MDILFFSVETILPILLSQLVNTTAFITVKLATCGAMDGILFFFRPMDHFHFTVWLLHCRLCCDHASGKNGCGTRTFTEYDQDFLSQVPTPVAECFPFVTVPGGLGIHEALLYQFMYLVMKGVLFGSWCQSINEAKNTLYAKSHFSHLDCVSEWKMNHPALYNNNNVVIPFSPPRQVGNYNWMPIEPKFTCKVYIQVRITNSEVAFYIF
jgi:hypothetical protein